jgi:23S rRNA (uracil1939-C5)-methyltransferase/tRNA (uracil-5-)-methyltransferase
VPGALPDELVSVRLYRRQADALWADVLELHEASAARVPPVCPLFGVCGGCQLQHLPYALQLEAKTAQVKRAFAAVGLEEARIQATRPCPQPFGYRSKITPHFARPRADQPFAIGFLKIGRRQDVVDVPHCPLATTGVNAALPALRAAVHAEAAAGRYKQGVSLLLREATSGVTSDPDSLVTERVGDLTLRFFARDFFQNNPFLLPAMVDHVVALARESGATALVDTYCGSGLFALAAAKAFSTVVGVEVSPSAVARATENAAANGLSHARFVVGDAAAVFAHVAAPPGETVVVVDPPRKGCDEAFLSQLAAFRPRAVIYVSCNPLTQARDVAWLAARGFRVDDVTPFDMFPQTRHLESVALLRSSP